MAETKMECPYCEAEISPSAESECYTCDRCGREMSSRALFLHARGCEYFLRAGEIGAEAAARKKPSPFDPPPAQALPYLLRAYSALQEAFQLDLPGSLRDSGIEMMAEITRVFALQEKVSPLEARYWGALRNELAARQECDEISRLLADPTGWGAAGLFIRLRRRWRRRQLCRSLPRLAEQIRRLEGYICFATPPRVRPHAQEEQWP